MTCPFTIDRSRSASLSASKNATPKPTNGSVGRTDAGIERRVRKRPATVVAEETGRFELVIGHDQIEPAVPVVVGELRAHARSRLAVPGHGDARKETDLAEAATTLVVKKKIGHRVVGHEHIGPPVVVVVPHGNAETVADVLRQPSRRAHIRERALAVVAIENVGHCRVHERVAVHANAALRITAEAVVGLRRIEVIRHEQIEIAVDIHVEERTARAPPREPDTCASA